MPFDGAEPQQVAVRIFTFQRADHYTVQLVVPGAAPDEVVTGIAEEVLDNADDFALAEVYPQLPDDTLSVCVYPAWWADTGEVPAVIDSTEVRGVSFLVKIPMRSSARDLLRAYGDVLPPRTAFYLRNDSRPFNDLETRAITTGALIRILPTDHILVQMPNLREALEDLYWCRDLEVAGLPTAPPSAGQALLIGPTVAFVTDLVATLPVLDVHSIAADSLAWMRTTL